MRLTWKITKKRGNWRPVLEYACQKEDWEIDLAVPGGKTPVTVEAAWDYFSAERLRCLPGQDERGENAPTRSVELCLPSSEVTGSEKKVILIWKAGASPAYPEVEQAMRDLLAEWERRVLDTLQSGEINREGSADHSEGFRDAVVPYVAARRILQPPGT